MSKAEVILIMASLTNVLNKEGINAEFKGFRVDDNRVNVEVGLTVDPEAAGSITSILESSGFKPIGKAEVNDDAEGKKTKYIFSDGDIDLYFIVQNNGESSLLAVAPIGSNKS